MSLLEGPALPRVAPHERSMELCWQRELLHHWKRGTAWAAPAQLLAKVLQVYHLEGAEALLWEPHFMQMICPTQPVPGATHTRVH